LSWTGLTFAFGEGGSKRVLAGVLFGAGMAIAAVLHGFTKPRETNHDPDLFRLYQRPRRRSTSTEAEISGSFSITR